MITLKDILGVTDKESAGNRIYYKIGVLLEDDVDYSKLPTIDEVARTCAAFTLKTGASGIKTFVAAHETPSEGSEGSRGDITADVKNTVAFTVGGNRPEVNDFLENHTGDAAFLFYVEKYSKKIYVIGRPYSPLFFSAFTRRDNKDNASTDLTFSNSSFSQPPEYLGTLPFQTADGI